MGGVTPNSPALLNLLYCKLSSLQLDDTSALIQLGQDEYQEIYLAIQDEIYETFFQRKSIQAVIKRHKLDLLVVNIKKEEVVQWIN